MSLKRPIAFIVAALLVFQAAAALAAPSLDEAILDLTHRWARVNYRTAPEAQGDGFRDLVAQSERVCAAFPGRAEPMVWQAIALSSDAKAEGGIGALSQVRKARDLLIAAEKIDPNALNGSIYTSLGTLYANVPGWPIGFGDATQARKYLEQALRINPAGIDQNYFYGEFLAGKGEYAKAYEHLKQALNAAPRPDREDSDSGRRQEAQRAMTQIRQKHADQLAGL